jgi:cell division transport system permease protein
MRGDPSVLERMAAAFEEAALSLWRRRPQLVATVAIVATSLAFPAALVLVLGWGSDLAAALASRERLRVFVLDDASDEEVAAVEEALASSPGIAATKRVSATEAEAIFLRRFPELAPTVAGLGSGALALPRSIEATGDGSPATFDEAARLVRGLPGVEEVRSDAASVERLASLRSSLALASTAVALIALAATAAVIGNVIRISALSRREQLAVMRLVGAPRFHVRAPFIVEGMVQGALGGGLAALALTLARWTLREPLAHALPASAEGLGMSVLPLLVAPGLAGALSAWWAVESVLRRHARLER